MKAALLLIKDPWFVLAAVLAATSGGATFSGRAAGRTAPAGTASASAPAPSSAASGAASVFPSASVPPAFPTSASGAGPSIQGQGFTRILQAKTPGRWIVDAAKAKDSDTDSLGDAVANAKDGDSIILRPGRYQGGLRIEKSLAIVGEPGQGTPPVIEAAGGFTIESLQGDLRLESVVVRQGASSSGRGAIQAKSGSLTLKKVQVESESGDGLFNWGAKLVIEASSFRSKEYGLYHRQGTLRCSGCAISGSVKQGLYVGADATETYFADSVISDNGSGGGAFLNGPTVFERVQVRGNKGAGVWVARSVTGPVRLADCRIFDNIGAGFLLSGGTATLEKVEIYRNRESGFSAGGAAGSARLTDFKSYENGDDGLGASGSVVLSVLRGEITGNRDNGVWAGGATRLTLKDCRVNRNMSNGVWAVSNSRVELDGCDFTGNQGKPYQVGDEAAVTGRSVPALPKLEGSPAQGTR
ncbi:MAG: right-handed parallel beta-helix repeat-containing protein [Elusimicrobia bacterium]|nr:right-handed parallel beta-helix repeat-containing protein [Elusimicrobiota bacterium]